jgi:hypothetical protein
MYITDLAQPVARFRCGELDESYPEAYAAFKREFLVGPEGIEFAVCADQHLWAFVDPGREVYKWDGRTWVDMLP